MHNQHQFEQPRASAFLSRMAYSNELNDWNRCFFNEEQAVEGYKVFSGVIYKVKLHHKESVAERNLDMVNQLLEVIE
ncbi:MAG: hypothetical protein MUE72_07170 [Chitinophagaceae bacterium]|nr:hypothetical protein [Chitinophagaceae bacterium]